MAGGDELDSTTTSLGDRRAGRARIRQIALVHSAQGATSRTTLSTAAPVVVGREPGPGGLQIPDREISRKHAVFEPDGAGWPLADGEVRAVGASEAHHVDVRIIAASLRDLGALVEQGELRGDLHARLAGWQITVPPLRARRDDILRLATAWLAEHHAGMTLSPAAAEALCLFHWPYNVRQLEQVLGVSAVRAEEAGVISVDHMPTHVAEPLLSRLGATLPPVDAAALVLDVDPTQANPPAADLEKALRHFAGSVADVAVFFNRDRRQVYRWLKRYGIDPDLFRDTPPPR